MNNEQSPKAQKHPRNYRSLGCLLMLAFIGVIVLVTTIIYISVGNS